MKRFVRKFLDSHFKTDIGARATVNNTLEITHFGQSAPKPEPIPAPISIATPTAEPRLAANSRIVLIGDSTIDNKHWAPDGHSVVDHLESYLPDADIVDLTNDGFTTGDVLRGAERCKAVMLDPRFPKVSFCPITDGERAIKSADKIIISVGGNNIREFLLDLLDERGKIVSFDKALKTLLDEYKTILTKVRELNPNAEVIIMTQYYPALDQTFMPKLNLYSAMSGLSVPLSIISVLRNFQGSSMNVSGVGGQSFMHSMMKKLFNEILDYCVANDLRGKVVNVTSSLDPHISEDYRMQIEPSATGGDKIARMLTHAVTKPVDYTRTRGEILTYKPEFFATGSDRDVVVQQVIPNMKFTPFHPKDFAAKKSMQLVRYAGPIDSAQSKAVQQAVKVSSGLKLS